MKKKPRWSRRPDERPEALLDAALEVFSRVGYRAARLEEVAEVAGVSKGTVYHYFRDKEELLARALIARIDATFAGISGIAETATGTAAEKLRAVLSAAWSRWTDPATAKLQRLVMGEIRLDYPQLFQRAMRAGPMHLAALVARILEEGKDRGEVAPAVASEAVARFVVFGMLQQALLSADVTARAPSGAKRDQLFEASLGTILNGVLVRGPANERAGRASPRASRSPRKASA